MAKFGDVYVVILVFFLNFDQFTLSSSSNGITHIIPSSAQSVGTISASNVATFLSGNTNAQILTHTTAKAAINIMTVSTSKQRISVSPAITRSQGNTSTTNTETRKPTAESVTDTVTNNITPKPSNLTVITSNVTVRTSNVTARTSNVTARTSNVTHKTVNATTGTAIVPTVPINGTSTTAMLYKNISSRGTAVPQVNTSGTSNQFTHDNTDSSITTDIHSNGYSMSVSSINSSTSTESTTILSVSVTSSSTSGLKPGVVAGIVIIVLIAVTVIVIALYHLVFKDRKSSFEISANIPMDGGKRQRDSNPDMPDILNEPTGTSIMRSSDVP